MLARQGDLRRRGLHLRRRGLRRVRLSRYVGMSAARRPPRHGWPGHVHADAEGVVACDPLESSGGYLTSAESAASEEAAAHVVLPAPPVVAGMRGVEEVAVSPLHVCTLDASGDVQCWGQWSLVGRGDMGRWTQTPVEVAGIADAVGIALHGARQWSRGAACALLRSGHVSCWGDGLPFGHGPRPPFCPRSRRRQGHRLRRLQRQRARRPRERNHGTVVCG